jgi:hypothetical protein
MKILIIGNGQIGQAIHQIVSPHHEVYVRDIVEENEVPNPEVIHICYPDNIYFISETRKYIAHYKPQLTIIHSSVAPGKTLECGDNVVHAPVRGRHPQLAQQIPAFPIFIGAQNQSAVRRAVEYLSSCNLVCTPVPDSFSTELVKLISNVHMGLEIAWRQEVGRILEKAGVDPLVYERWEDSYNEGYRFTDNEQLIRPRLRPDPIGGHCILECTAILANHHSSKLFDFIKDSNEAEKDKRSSGKAETRETARA